MNLTDSQLSQRGSEKLELAILSFFEQFRKMYVGDQAQKTSKVKLSSTLCFTPKLRKSFLDAPLLFVAYYSLMPIESHQCCPYFTQRFCLCLDYATMSTRRVFIFVVHLKTCRKFYRSGTQRSKTPKGNSLWVTFLCLKLIVICW